VAECSHSSVAPISSILIENGIDFNAIDSGQNNGKSFRSFFFRQASSNFHFLALHIAVQHGNLAVVEILLEKSDIDVNLLNSKQVFKIRNILI
jgi:hypothetical protein